MRTIFVYFALLTSFLGFSQTPFPQQEIQYSPGGIFDTVFDNYGNKFLLKDLKINTDPSSATKTVTFNDCNSGYFKLYYEEDSGFDLEFDSDHIQRRAVLCQLFYDMSQFVVPVNPSTSVNIWIRKFDNSDVPPSVALAYASSLNLIAPISNTSLGGGITDNTMWQTINSGTDPFLDYTNPISAQGSAPFYHGVIAFNFNYSWLTDLTISNTGNLYDLYTVGLHEVTHALGLGTLINQNGQSNFGGGYSYYSRYDKFLQTTSGTNVISNSGACGSMYGFSFNPFLNLSVLTSNGVNCSTSNLIKFGGNVNQNVYTSSSFQDGTSLSHLEDQCHLPNAQADDSYYVMSNSSGLFIKRFLKPEERQLLCDLGYKLNFVYGNTTNSTYKDYGSSICGGNQIVGVNDGITLNVSGNSYTYIVNTNSNVPVSISTFLDNDYNPNSQSLTYECPQSVYGLGTVTSINATTIEYLPNNTGSGVDLIRYIPIVNGQKGNITYIYIYVKNGNCSPLDACNEYVNNGGFENSSGSSCLWTVNCWSSYSQTPDLFGANSCPFPEQILPTSYSIPSSYTWNPLNGNNKFVGLYGEAIQQFGVEGIQNNLKTPLIPGENYILSFRAKVANNYFASFNYASKIIFYGSNNSMISSSPVISALPPPFVQLAPPQLVPFNNDWNYFQIPFNFSSNNNNNPSNFINYLTILNGAFLTNENSYVYIDDISIVKANDQITFTPPSTVCISQNLNLQDYTNIQGGIFSGSGVSGTTFNPGIAGLGTHQITYSYSDNMNCVTNISAIITVNILPIASITGNNTVCVGSNSTLTASGGGTYSWSNGATSSVITISPTTTTNYIVTVTNCGSTVISSITINCDQNTACCSTPDITIPSNSFSISYGSNISNSTIKIQGDFTINSNISLSNCMLRMAPNARIIVNQGKTLNLTSCKLYSCTEMWQGIIVLPGGILNMSGTRIEDALEAVSSSHVGGLTTSIIINSCTFNKNKTGIYLQGFTNMPNILNGTNSTFDCTAAGSLTSNTNFLKAPHLGQKSHYGIYLFKVNGLTVGGATLPNIFQNLEVGIYVKSGDNISIVKNNFMNINSVCPVSGACTSTTIKGWGIYADNVDNITIGNPTSTVLGNSFTNSYNGIGIEGCPKFAIHRNTFSNITTPAVQSGMIPIDFSTAYCISVKNYAGSTLANNVIQNNTFTTFENGLLYKNNLSNSLNINNNIWSSFNSLDATAINILDNPIQTISILKNVFNNLTTQTGKNAIKVENVSVGIGIGQSLLISQNTIRNVNKGIWITNYNSPQIIDHNSNLYSIGSAPTGTRAGIYFPATLTGATVLNANAGIHINNCPSATISNNTIERTNYTAIAPAPLAANQFNLQFGISVGTSCTGTQVSNNVIKLMGSGIYYFGNTPISLKCNNMVNNSTGLWLNGQIGQQGTVSAPQDNKWTIPTGYIGVRRNGNPNITSSPVFFTRALFNSSPTVTSQFMPNTNTQMIPPFAANPPAPQLSTINAANLCFISAPPPAGLVQIVNEEGEYSYLPEEELKTLDVDLYKTLKINPDFYDQSTFEGLEIQEFIDSVELSNSAKIYQYEEKLSEKDTLGAKELMALFEAYSDVELNYKRVYEIYNRSWLEKEIEFTAEDSLVLSEIAYLSPRVAGNAVYTARVLLGLMIIDTETYSAKSSQINTSNENSDLRIYPNPSSDFFNYFLPLKEEDKGTISIIDISGKEIQTWSADYSTDEGTLDIQRYAKGVYFFELTINGNQKLVKKLIVK